MTAAEGEIDQLNSDVVLKSQINGLQSFGPYIGETTINIITSSVMYNEFLMIGLHGTESILTSVIHNGTKATVKDYGRAGDITAENLNEYSCEGVPLFRRNGYRQSGGRKPLYRNRDTALN